MTTQTQVLDRLPTSVNRHYVGNREPLSASPFRKLPIGAIEPRGWVRKQLQLQADGFIGHLTDISPWLDKKNNAWLSRTGEGEHAWEELPYWLKGFGDTGYLLGNRRIIDEAKVWIDGIIGSQQPDGWIGPKANKLSNDGKPDMWPNMVAINCLQTYYEHSGDQRVIDLMRRYFRYQMDLPEDSFYLSYWEKHRGGDNLESVYWLYNRTGEPWLLDLARKIHRRTAPWEKEIPDLHGVNFAQAFREPYQMSVLSHDEKQAEATERDYSRMRWLYGQVPGGLYGADENARYGFGDPRQAAETCAMVEIMLSHENLLVQSGDPIWAERCEDVAFNSLPASMTDDLKALHYLTSPNMILCDAASKSPGLQNGGPMLLFDPHDHRCCQHNVSHGWPYYAEHLWLATADDGLGAALYAPSRVKAKVGEQGREVEIVEETKYPFDETVRFTIKTQTPTTFPLTLRLPSWCEAPELTVAGQRQPLARGKWAVVTREWRDGDTVELRLPMHITLRQWTQNHDSVSVDRGPLTYSLRIQERLVRKGGTDAWPAYEIHPQSAWNYGLASESFEVVNRPWPKNDQPFSLAGTPIELRSKGRRIPEWTQDHLGLVGLLQQSPAYTVAPEETITLVPMGAARLRIASFPTVSDAASANHWEVPKQPKKGLPGSASWIHPADTLDALTDGLTPKNSNDLAIPRFTWWEHKGTTEWVELDLVEERTMSEAWVYWFDDRHSGGGCRLPASWKLSYFRDGGWHEVQKPGEYPNAIDRFNEIRFEPAAASRWRITVKLQEGFSGGILEWVLR